MLKQYYLDERDAEEIFENLAVLVEMIDLYCFHNSGESGHIMDSPKNNPTLLKAYRSLLNLDEDIKKEIRRKMPDGYWWRPHGKFSILSDFEEMWETIDEGE